jgi:hypothetical protein
MEAVVEFHHRWWHHVGWWATIALAATMAGVTTYAALFAPPVRSGQWIPLLLLIVGFWAGTGFIRAGEPSREYRFCNWFGEANDLAAFSIDRCIQEHGV